MSLVFATFLAGLPPSLTTRATIASTTHIPTATAPTAMISRSARCCAVSSGVRGSGTRLSSPQLVRYAVRALYHETQRPSPQMHLLKLASALGADRRAGTATGSGSPGRYSFAIMMSSSGHRTLEAAQSAFGSARGFVQRQFVTQNRRLSFVLALIVVGIGVATG